MRAGKIVVLAALVAGLVAAPAKAGPHFVVGQGENPGVAVDAAGDLIARFDAPDERLRLRDDAHRSLSQTWMPQEAVASNCGFGERLTADRSTV